MTPEERIITTLDIQDRANMVAINFAGETISSGDGTYDCLRYDVANAIREIAGEAIKAEREACAKIADEESQGASTYQWQHAGEQIAEKIRARSEGEQQQKGD